MIFYKLGGAFGIEKPASLVYELSVFFENHDGFLCLSFYFIG